MPKFFVSNEQINNEKIDIIGEDVNHIANVLRLQKEDEILVCDKETNITYQAIIRNISKEKIECQIESMVNETTESNIDVSIFQGLPKADKMEYIIQKSTELGVKTIIPVAMKRSIVKIDSKDENKKIDRWQKIAEVAAKQSGRDVIPKIEKVHRINQIIENIKDYDLYIIAYENEKNITLKQVLKEVKKDLAVDKGIKIGVLIGPEGGIDETEVNELVRNGAKVITLGSRILRTETASLAILSNIMYEYEL